MNITISGDIASGKTTLANYFVSKGYELYSAGRAYREVAETLGISVIDLNLISEANPAIDDDIDEKMKEYCNTHDNLVIDARMGFKLCPNAYSVYLMCDPRISAARVWRDEKLSKSYKDIVDCFIRYSTRNTLRMKDLGRSTMLT